MKNLFINTRAIVIIGYCLLVILAITGFITIYFEVIKSLHQSKDDSILKQELINLSNTLTTMYQAEGTANLLVFAENENFKQEYDSLTNRVFEQIDSLRSISIDKTFIYSLDSLSFLLSEKRENALEMIQLIKQIDKNIVQEFKKTTIISSRDIEKLSSILTNFTQLSEDTVQIIAEKKNFFQRFRALVKPDVKDTLTQISKGSITETVDIITPLLVDTIVDFIKKLDRQKQLKNVKIINQLIIHQHELYAINELTGLQINKIMDALKEREYQANLIFLEEKNESLKRSSKLVSLVGFSALFVAVFFMSWTLISLNKAQRLQKSIQDSKKSAEKLLKFREQLIYTVSHDIKTPLSSIIGFLDLMSEDTLSQNQHYYLNNMHSSASHILELVNNLLDFNSIEKEQPKLSNIAFLPSVLLNNIYTSFTPMIQKKKLKCEFISTLDESKAYISDPYYISQIINNLLSNAIKYTQEQGKVSIITSMEKENLWKISIQDNGPGIALSDQAKIFDEYTRLGKQKFEVEGTGLGLTISKKLAALLNGKIEVKSQLGAGSTFTLIVPVTQVVEEKISQQSKTIESNGDRILFVDDDISQLNLLSELMKKHNISYVCCSSAYEALKVFERQLFNLVFTDLNIAEVKGFELARQIKEKNSNIPIIAFSASSPLIESELRAAGFSGFLQKPFNVTKLMEIIEEFTSFKWENINSFVGNIGYGWQELMDFAANDKKAAIKIIDSFIDETNKNKKLLRIAFLNKNYEDIKEISHKMLSLMKIIAVREIVSILNDFEKGDITQDKKVALFHLLDETLNKAKAIRKGETL